MWVNLALSVASAAGAFGLWRYGAATGFIVGLGLLSGWQFYSALSQRRRSPVIVRLGGFSWAMEDFCRGWLITGETGSGKTLGGINTLLWQVCRNCPTWGGVCVDDKGLYAHTLRAMLAELGRADDLIVLEGRPENAPAGWQPRHTLNFLEDPYLPYSGKAKIVCDVATAQGQRTDQSFFRT